MTEIHNNNGLGNSLQPSRGRAITPSNSIDYEDEQDYFVGTLFIGTGGDVNVQLASDPDGTNTLYKNIPDGSDFPRLVRKVLTGTTASNIILER